MQVPPTDIYVDLGTEGEPALVRWSAPSLSGASRHEGYALVTADGPVIIDPPAPDADGGDRLVSLLGARPVATVLTNDWHERSCYALRERWDTPVWAPAAGLPARGGELEGEPDYLYEESTALPGGLRALKIDGVFAGEHVLHWRAPTGEGVLFTGDVVNGQNTELRTTTRNWRDAPGLYLGVALLQPMARRPAWSPGESAPPTGRGLPADLRLPRPPVWRPRQGGARAAARAGLGGRVAHRRPASGLPATAGSLPVRPPHGVSARGRARLPVGQHAVYSQRARLCRRPAAPSCANKTCGAACSSSPGRREPSEPRASTSGRVPRRVRHLWAKPTAAGLGCITVPTGLRVARKL